MSNTAISEILERIQTLPDKVIEDFRVPKPWHYRYSVKPPETWDKQVFQDQFSIVIPPELETLWSLTSEVRLNEELNYGQWGMIVWGPARTLEQQSHVKEWRGERDFRSGDLVIGEFLGDLDLVILRCDPAQPDFGSVTVALPIDPREDWYNAVSTLSQLLEGFLESPNRKYWVPLKHGEERRMQLTLKERILGALHYENAYYRGRYAAFKFVTYDNSTHFVVRPIPRIQQELDLISTQIVKTKAVNELIYHRSEQVYLKGYQGGLIYTKNVISGRGSMPQNLIGQVEPFSTREQSIFHNSVATGSLVRGLAFAIKQNADAAILQAEIDATKNKLSSLNDSMRVEAELRIKQAAYLVGLKAALTIIEQVTMGEDLPLACPSETDRR